MLLKMAWRNIWRNRARSMVIITSIALGVMAGIFMAGMYKGMLSDRLKAVIYREVGHLQIHHPAFPRDMETQYLLPDEQALTASLDSIHGIRSFAQRTIVTGMAMTASINTGVEIIGVDPAAENLVSSLYDKWIEGDTLDFDKRNKAVIGAALAEKMHLHVGSKIILTFSDTTQNLITAAFKVCGLYKSQNAPLDERLVYVRRSDLNELMGLEHAAHEIAVLLNDDEHLDTMTRTLSALLPDHLVENWRELSPETNMMIETTDKTAYVFITIIMIALAFGVVNTMLMAILERTKEIGVLLAVGLTKSKLFALVLLETVLLTLAGVPVGMFLIYLIIQYYAKHGINIAALTSNTMSEFGFSDMLYLSFPYEKMAGIVLIVFITAVLAAIFPSAKAMRLQPVEAVNK